MIEGLGEIEIKCNHHLIRNKYNDLKRMEIF